MTKVTVLYRLPAVVTVDIDSGHVESVELDSEVRVDAWAGACTQEPRARTIRGAREDEIVRALRIVSERPWPRASLTAPA